MDHTPPHIHVSYSGHKASVTISTITWKGKMPPRAERLVEEWIRLHQEELLGEWYLAKAGKELHTIDPLP